MAKDDRQMADASQARRLDIRLFLHRQHIAARDAGKRRDVAHRHSNDDIAHPKAQDGHESNGQNEDGKGKETIHDAHDNGVHHPAVIARNQAQGNPDDHR